MVLGDQLHSQTTLVGCGGLLSPTVVLLAFKSHRGWGRTQVLTKFRMFKGALAGGKALTDSNFTSHTTGVCLYRGSGALDRYY